MAKHKAKRKPKKFRAELVAMESAVADPAAIVGERTGGEEMAPAPAKPKRAKRSKATEPATKFPVRARPPLPPELRGDLALGLLFSELPIGAMFRYRGAVEMGFNELWRKHDEQRYSDGEAVSDYAFPSPDSVRVLPA